MIHYQRPFLFGLIVVSILQLVSAEEQIVINATCNDTFPRVIVKAIYWPKSMANEYQIISTDACYPNVTSSKLVRQTYEVAGDPVNNVICARPETTWRKFYCWNKQRNVLDGIRDLPEPSVEDDYLIKFDPYGKNIYWKQREGKSPTGHNSHIFVTSLATKVSKVLVLRPGDLTHMAVDAINGRIFWIRDKVILGSSTSNVLEALSPTEIIQIVPYIEDLTLDHREKTLYWCAYTNTLFKAKYDGTDFEQYKIERKDLFQYIRFYSVKFFDGFLYFVRGNDLYGHVLGKFDWKTKTEVDRLLGAFTKNLVAMAIYEKEKNVPENPCDKMNCTHICLPERKNESQCACPSYMSKNGSGCTSAPLLVLVRSRDVIATHYSLLELDGSRLGLSAGQVLFSSDKIDWRFGILSTLSSDTVCLKIRGGSKYSEFTCSGRESSALKANLNQLHIEDTENTRLVSTTLDGRHGTLLSINAETSCVNIYNLATKTAWRWTCLPNMDARYVAFDTRALILFYRNNKTGFFEKRNLETGEYTNMAIDWEISTTTTASANNSLMCVDGKNEKLYWMSGRRVKWMPYKGTTFQTYESQLAAKQLRLVRCGDDRPYWVETLLEKNELDDIVTLDVKFGVAERVHKGELRSTIVDFKPGTETEVTGGGDSPCQRTNCSHLCTVDQFYPQVARCFCPVGMVLQDPLKCAYPQVLFQSTNLDVLQLEAINLIWVNVSGLASPLKSTSRNGSDNDRIPDRSNATDAFKSLQRFLNLNSSSLIVAEHNAVGVVVHKARDDYTLCWIQSRVVTCATGSKAPREVGHTNAKFPLLFLNDDGKQLIWNAQDPGCFKLTKLSTNETFSFSCFSLGHSEIPVITLDIIKLAVFWCDNIEKNLKMKLLYEDDSRGRILYSWYGLTPFNCTGIATDPYGERLFLIQGNSVFSFHYENLLAGNKAGVPNRLATLTYTGGANMSYRNRALYWMNREGGMEVMNVGFDTSFPREVIFARFQHPSIQINFMVPLSPNFEVTRNYPCSYVKCPVFCLSKNPFTTYLGEAICKCPDNQEYDSKSRTCEGVKAQSWDWQRVGPLLAGVLVPFLLTIILGILIFLLLQKRATHMDIAKYLQGQLSANPNENYGSWEDVPFTKGILPELLKIDKSNVLGTGCFGIVYGGTLNDTPVAVKTLQIGFSKQLLLEFVRELKVMVYVGDHENIVHLFGAEISEAKKGRVWMVLEKSPFGSLLSHLRENAENFVDIAAQLEIADDEAMYHVLKRNQQEYEQPERKIRLSLPVLGSWATQIACGMRILERKNVTHGDLAARNVLVFPDNVVKISDFGFSRNLYQYSSYVKRKSVALPWRWAALETLEKQEFSLKSDVWAFAVTVWEIFTLGMTPFSGLNPGNEFIANLRNGLRLDRPTHLPERVYQAVLIPCWSLKPSDRPCFEELAVRVESMFRDADHDHADQDSGTQDNDCSNETINDCSI